jgi:hypothetical protein
MSARGHWPPREIDVHSTLPIGRSKRKLWLLLIACLLLLALGVYAARMQLERAIIAVEIYRTHAFTPPPVGPGESRLHWHWANWQFYSDFSALRVARDSRLQLLNPELKPLVNEIARRQAAGEGMQYSMHIYREIRWRLNFTPDVEATRARIADLRQSLNQPEFQKLAAQQLPFDGSWGTGINVWYLKLYYSVEDGLKSSGPLPQYPLTFLDRINSPVKLTQQLDSDLHDDFTKTGVFNREELDETFSAMARLLYRHKQTGYAFDPTLGDALRQFVARWQNPETGFWGQWVIDRHGRIWKMDDMAMTFHVISDLSGEVEHKEMIAQRLLQLDKVNFPAGIRFDGHYENHLNMDVVKIFRLTWPVLDEPTRHEARAEISRMLDWCLAKSLQPDGSFEVSELDDTTGDAFSYGVSFLNEAGYLRPENRFWTDQDFPESHGIRDRIEAKIKSIGLNDPGMRDAFDQLQGAK